MRASSFSIAFLACLASLMIGCSTAPEKRELTDEERARLFLNSANGAILERDYTGALQNLVEAERLDPKIPDVYHSKAIALYMKFDLQGAVLAANKAVSLAPKNSDARNTLGKLLIDQGKLTEAEGHLLASAKDPLYRNAYKARTNLGILYYKLGNYAEASQNLDIAIRDEPVLSCHAYYYRGHIHLRDGRFSQAVKDYDSATKKACAGFADAHLALGIAYERKKDYARARKKYIEIESSFPDSKVAEKAIERLRYLP